MTDHIPADKVEKIADAMRVAMRRDENTYSYAEFLDDMSGYIRDLEALLPQRPTLADTPRGERASCQWMQADTETWGRAVILHPEAQAGLAALLDRWGKVIYEDHTDVTPRPDLPRMEWPGDQKPDPAPALPDGWRLADHPDHGRVIVTDTTMISDGRVYFVFPSSDRLGYDWFFCDPAELTYIDQGADTADTVPENTLAAMIAGMREEWGVILPGGQLVGAGWGTHDTALEDMNAWRRDGYDARLVRRYVTEPEDTDAVD